MSTTEKPPATARQQLVADTEALDEAHGGDKVMRGGLGTAEVVVRDEGAVEQVYDAEIVDEEEPQHLIARPLPQQVVHVITTLPARPVVQRTGAVARPVARAGWTVGQGVVSGMQRAYSGATFGHLREQIRLARASGDAVALREWEEVLQKSKDARTKRAVLRPQVVTSYARLAVGGLVLVLIALVIGGISVWVADGGMDWDGWWSAVGRRLDNAATVAKWLFAVTPWALLGVGLVAAHREGVRFGLPPRALTTERERAEADSHLDERMISLAFLHLGIPALTKYLQEGGHLEFIVMPRVDGDGTYAQVRTPPGVTAEMVAERKKKLAGNLYRAALETWPTTGQEESICDLWVADKGVLNAGAGPWPLQDDGTVDLFEGVPIGLSQRGDTIVAPIFETNYLIGGRPGQGKSAAMRTLLLGCALDPTAELMVYVMGESPDFKPFEPRLSRYAMGMDDSVVAEAVQTLRDLIAEMERRGKVLGKQSGSPPKTSRKLANRRELGLHLIVCAIDECFPSGTLVGDVPIEQLRPGDVVPSWDEMTGEPCDGEVRAIFRKRPNALVRVVWHDGTTLVCTPNHPLMTREGWAAAGDLTSTSEVLTYGQARRADRRPVLDLRDSLHAPVVEARVLEAVRPGGLLTGLRDHVAPGERRADTDVVGILCCDGSADAGAESHAGRQRPAVGVGPSAGDRSSSARTGWQWAGPVDGAASAGGRARMADGGHRPDRAAREGWAAESLQAGRGQSGLEGGDRDRRPVALLAGTARAGQPEDCVADWRRVDRVEILEPGSDGRYGGLCPDGFVYNFEVAGTHVYRVADGVVAHNCHEMFQHPEYKKEAEAAAVRLIKRGRKYGIVLVLATQSPTATSLPKEVTRNIGAGVAFAVADHIANDGLLGTGKYKAGIRATELRMKTDRGTSVTVGITDNPFELIRWFYVPFEDGRDDVTPIIARSMAGMKELRRTGEPLAVEAAPAPHLRDVWEVLNGPREELRDVVPRLRDAKPDLYGKWNQKRLIVFLEEECEVPVGTLDGYRVVLAADVETALESSGSGDDEDL